MPMTELAGLLRNNCALESILNSIGDAVSIQNREFKVLFQNELHKKLFGDHAGESCYKGFHKRDSICENCYVEPLYRDPRAHTVVRVCTANDRQIFTETTASPIKNAEGEIVASIKISRDITDRVKIEESLNETRQMVEDIAQGITESILLLSADHKVLWANKAALEQTGLEEDQFIGNHCYKVTHDSETHCQPPDDPCPVAELIKTGLPKTSIHKHHDREGRDVYVQVSAYPIRDNDGAIIRFVHISKDITERRSFEIEREKLIQELQSAVAEIKALKGVIPICSSCKNIRDDRGYWQQLESYMSSQSGIEFTHGLCPKCARKLYSDFMEEMD